MIRLFIDEKEKKGVISPDIYGHFAEHLGRCVYEGLFVGEESAIPNVNGMHCDAVEALKKIKIPFLRWPGGCFASEYHWRDGIGDRKNRRVMVNTTWGMVTDDLSFGTDEYMELCRQLGCKTYVNGNISSGTVSEMAQWVEYMTAPAGSSISDMRVKNGHKEPYILDYFGVGNEPWGDGKMRPEYYSDLYRNYQHYLKQFSPDHPFKKVCCGFTGLVPEWSEKVIALCHEMMDLYSIHYYCTADPINGKVSATDFDEEIWYNTLKKALVMDTCIRNEEAVLDRYDPEKRIGLAVDEWGTWFNAEPGTVPGFLYQQNTVRDALVAAVTFDIFNKHWDRVRLCAIAQTCNVLQAPILTEKEKFITTPTYHIFRQYSCHQGADYLNTYITGMKKTGIGENLVPEVSHTVSVKEGIVNISLSNLSATEEKFLETEFLNSMGDVIESTVVTGGKINSCNTFDCPNNVEEKIFDKYSVKDNKINIALPPHSVVLLRVKI